MAAPLIKTGSGKQFVDGHRSAYRIINRIIIRQTMCAACTKPGGGGEGGSINVAGDLDTGGTGGAIVTIKRRAFFLSAGLTGRNRLYVTTNQKQGASRVYGRFDGTLGKTRFPSGSRFHDGRPIFLRR